MIFLVMLLWLFWYAIFALLVAAIVFAVRELVKRFKRSDH